MNVVSFLDGSLSVLEIAEKCEMKYSEVIEILEKLISADLVEKA